MQEKYVKTQRTHWTRCCSLFFSSASLFNTDRMASCSSSERKLRSIMVNAATAGETSHCSDCVSNGRSVTSSHDSPGFFFYSHRSSQFEHAEVRNSGMMGRCGHSSDAPTASDVFFVVCWFCYRWLNTDDVGLERKNNN